jgi:hypothetical protein
MEDTTMSRTATIRYYAARAHRVIAYVALAAIAMQFITAGAAIFGATYSFRPHHLGAAVVDLSGLLLFVTAVISRQPRRVILFSALFLVASPTQGFLAYARNISRLIAMFHPVHAIWLVYLGNTLARGRAQAVVPSRAAAPVRPTAAMAAGD